ncbi:Gcd10p family-domain-containing protein [Powellomyces hirtus]|nr:Gcd10p family-domain-containing protein [Powellomyces hirtus]
MEVDQPANATQLMDVAEVPTGNVIDDCAFIRDGSWAIIQLPSENTKLVHLKSNINVPLGKFGSFSAAELMGFPFDVPYEIEKEGINPAPHISSLEGFDIDTAEGASNKDLVDRREAQKLTQTDIEQLKAESMKGNVHSESVIKALLENSETWEQKTEFAKAKYIKRKQKKYSKIIIPQRPSARTLCEHFYKENPRRIMEMRVDTLSLMLTAANIHAGGRYIVVDEAGGLLTAALVERMQGLGTVFQLHEHEQNNVDLVKYLNLPSSVPNVLRKLSWGRLQANKDEDFENLDIACDDEAKLERYHARVNAIRANRAYLNAGGFDGLIIASQYDLKQVVDTLTPFLAGSKPIVAYSQFKETLTETWVHFRNSRDFVNAQLSEGWLREYQVVGGMHPMMRMSGTGGYILSALKVFDCETNATFIRSGGRGGGGRKKKQKTDE